MSKEYNFTVHSFRESNGDWGDYPKTGKWTDKNATFSGVFGGVINGDYDISITDWLQTQERMLWVDYSTPIFQNYFLSLTNAIEQPIQYSTFVRPFTSISWLCLMIVGFIICLSTLLAYGCGKYNAIKPEISYRTIIISSWLLFVILKAFYDGALIMFFVTESPVPFNNIRQGLQKYPGYKMVIIESSVIKIHSFALANDSVFVSYYNILQSEEGKELIGKSVKDSLEKLLNPGHFLAITSFILGQFLETNGPIKGLELKLISKELPTSSSMIFSKNSPWERVFNHGILRLREKGFIDASIKRFHSGLDFAKKANGDVTRLSIGHTAIGFIVYGALLSISLLLLIAELIWWSAFFNETANKIEKIYYVA